MRKIEQQMIHAISTKANWQAGNTSVHYNQRDQLSLVRLHGNLIAIVDARGDVTPNKAIIRQYPTVTTLSRLRALGVKIYKRNHVIYIDGEQV